MKKLLIFFLFSIGMNMMVTAQRTIKNPEFEFTNGGIMSISKIEFGKDATRLHILCQFVPHWWISFEKGTYVKDCDTEQKYFPIAVEGSEFDKEIYMPESGDSTLVLLYPPFDKKMKKFDWISGNAREGSIFGVSLKKASKRSSSKSDDKSLEDIWPEAGKKFIDNSQSDFSQNFFRTDTARIRGFMKGYDPRAGFSTAIIYSENILTREDYPTVVQFYPDGRFEADLLLNHPWQGSIFLKRGQIPFYIEPGETLFIELDWKDLLQADRFRDKKGDFPHTRFVGASATINREFKMVQLKNFNYQELRKKIEITTPEVFKKECIQNYKESKNSLLHQLTTSSFSPKAQELLNNRISIQLATTLLDFLSKRKYYSTQDSTNQIMRTPVPANFYDFLQLIDFRNNSLLATWGYSTFINRFEFMNPFRIYVANNYPMPEKSFWAYVQEKELTPTELSLIKFLESLTKKSKEEKEKLANKLAEIEKEVKEFTERHPELIKEYNEIYIAPLGQQYKKNINATSLEEWRKKDSVMQNQLHLSPNTTFDITKVRELEFLLPQMERNVALDYITKLNQTIANPFLQKESFRIFEKKFPSMEQIAYKLPEGKATELFRRMVDPQKGKYVLVDFWATTCGPCCGGIKQMRPIREKYKDSSDFTFVYITDDRSSPEKDYNDFIAENAMGENLFRITEDEYNYLRQLFKFNGIPRYVLLNREGDVVDDNFPAHNLEYELNRIFSK